MLKHYLFLSLLIGLPVFAMQPDKSDALACPEQKRILVTFKQYDDRERKYAILDVVVNESATIAEVKRTFNDKYRHRSCNLLVTHCPIHRALFNDELVIKVLRENGFCHLEIPH